MIGFPLAQPSRPHYLMIRVPAAVMGVLSLVFDTADLNDAKSLPDQLGR